MASRRSTRSGAKFTGRVTNITDYGAFVELEPGIEGLIHVSEMSWTKKNVHPGKIVSTSQEVEVMVLEVDPEKRRISLGLKQTLANPWETFADKYPVGSTVEGEVKNKTEFGLFIGLDGDVDGMVHLSDLDWQKPGEQALESTTGATWSRPRCSTSTWRRSASRSASSSWRPAKPPMPAVATASARTRSSPAP
jgi:ribosomal protein S1